MVISLRISELAERSGVPATTLRFYETAGLLPAERTAAGYRVYTDESVDRLQFIASAKHLGLPLEEIAELLAVWQAGSCSDVRADLRPRVAARIADAEDRLTELRAVTDLLHRALEHLDALPDRAERCDPECGFLNPAGPHAHPLTPVTLSRRPPMAPAERWQQAPVACSLTGDGMSERAALWAGLLDSAVREQVPDGLRLTLPASRASAVAGLALSEHQCCPFFDFQIHLDGAVMTLQVRAPVKASAMLAELFS
jgi:MerR family copper efflux transcriptional regulator